MHVRAARPCSLAILLALVAAPAMSAVRNVPADYPTIQQALNASTTGDDVLVAPGTYMERLILSSPQDGVRLVGVGGPSMTTIDGGNGGTVIACEYVGSQTQITGFTITHGLSYIGGGIALNSASPMIHGNVISLNVANAGAGIYASNSSPEITANEISRNQTNAGSGGGIYFDNYSSGRVESNLLWGNTCLAFGGAITIWVSSSPNLVGNTIVDNQADLGGGGIYVIRGAHATSSENIVAHNVGGGCVVGDPTASLTVGCSDVFGNPSGNYVAMADPTGTYGNISLDPGFCGSATHNYTLADSSPCAATAVPSGCVQMGALGTGCSVTPVARSTWGSLKAKYR